MSGNDEISVYNDSGIPIEYHEEYKIYIPDAWTESQSDNSLRLGRIDLYLLTKPAYVNIHCAHISYVALSPKAFKNLVSRKGPILV